MTNNRSLATRRVMKTIARRTPANPLPVKAQDGSTPVVVALPDDRLLDIATHVQKQFGGHANVFVTLPDHIALIDFQLDPSGVDRQDYQSGHANTSMAMYVSFLKMNPGKPSMLTLKMGSPVGADVQDIAYAF